MRRIQQPSELCCSNAQPPSVKKSKRMPLCRWPSLVLSSNVLTIPTLAIHSCNASTNSESHMRPRPTWGLPLTGGGLIGSAPALTFRPTRLRKSRPTSESIVACSLALFMHCVQTSPPSSALLNCRASSRLNASTSSLAHFTQALIMGGGKHAWKQLTVFRMMLK